MSENASSQPMTLLEAAHHLGITPELLIGYTNSRFRKSKSKRRRLKRVEIRGKTHFLRAELDDFDRYLREPWAEPGTRRISPPKCVVDHLRAGKRQPVHPLRKRNWRADCAHRRMGNEPVKPSPQSHPDLYNVSRRA